MNEETKGGGDAGVVAPGTGTPGAGAAPQVQTPKVEGQAPQAGAASSGPPWRQRRNGRPYGSGDDRGGRRPYFRKKVCKLCMKKAKSVDYKDTDLLRRFITDRGKILPRRITGTCAKHQRMVSRAIMRARMIALLPFVSK